MIERLSTKSVKDYLKTIIDCPSWHTGASDKNEEESITLYTNRRNISKISKFKHLQTYSVLPVTLLLRWTKNYKNAEEKANSIYELLDSSSIFLENYECFIDCLFEGPIDLGADENGIYKFSIEFNLIYKKKGD